MSKHAILVNNSVNGINNDESINVIVNNIMNDDFLYSNKEGNHTLENDIEKDDSAVVILQENYANANEEYLS